MSESVAERKNRLRQSGDYKKTRAIFDYLLLKSPIEYPRKRGLQVVPTPAEIYEENCVQLYEKWKKSERLSKILRGLKTQVEYPSITYESMSKLLVYLGLVESLAVTLMDMALILLIATGKAVHTRGPFAKHIVKFRELEEQKIPLDDKLVFLEHEGLNLFKKFVDSKLRNQIAHLKLTIQENGVIKDKGNNEIKIDDRISKFWEGVDILKLVFRDSGFLERLEQISAIVDNERRDCL